MGENKKLRSALNRILSKEPDIDLYDYMSEQINRMMHEKNKAIRLFFLMMFRTPLGCAEGDKKSLFYPNGDVVYFYNGISFAKGNFSSDILLTSTMDFDSISEYLRNVPMKKFTMFGQTFIRPIPTWEDTKQAIDNYEKYWKEYDRRIKA